eukprot:TRINITY_DN49816_c0_g1_i1.p1 TRINITY_DN49816_c0_g1~~TRINITY_DN49816_c0_g1_i1.p1  ORF type:complete len:106 (+),score=4.62 TRINITY_DN49816_c0_g1_i1:93-410(+)
MKASRDKTDLHRQRVRQCQCVKHQLRLRADCSLESMPCAQACLKFAEGSEALLFCVKRLLVSRHGAGRTGRAKHESYAKMQINSARSHWGHAICAIRTASNPNAR